MIQGILFCLLFLAAQLLLLAYIDYRTSHFRSEATYTARNLPRQHQHDVASHNDDTALPPPLG